MTRILSIFVLFAAICYLNADQIVPAALQKIFPYAAVAKVKTLTTNVNKQTAIAKAKTAVKNWVPKNWKAAGAKVDAKNQLSKQAYAQKKALTFIDYRFSLKKYINYLYNQAVNTKYMTKAEADNMRTMYWAADAKAENNYTLTCQTFLIDASAKIKKTPPIKDTVMDLTGKFAKANAKDYASLQWSL